MQIIVSDDSFMSMIKEIYWHYWFYWLILVNWLIDFTDIDDLPIIHILLICWSKSYLIVGAIRIVSDIIDLTQTHYFTDITDNTVIND